MKKIKAIAMTLLGIAFISALPRNADNATTANFAELSSYCGGLAAKGVWKKAEAATDVFIDGTEKGVRITSPQKTWDKQWYCLVCDIPVEAGKNYSLSFQYKSELATGNHCKINLFALGGKEPVKTIFVFSGTRGAVSLQEFKKEFNTEGATRASVCFYQQTSEIGKTTAWIREFSMDTVTVTAAKAKLIFLASGSAPEPFPPCDATLAQKLYKDGYGIELATYEQFLPAAAKGVVPGNVLVFTMSRLDPLRPCPFGSAYKDTLMNFIREGGGALFIVGFWGYGDLQEYLKHWNAFLAPLDAEVLYQRVSDQSNMVNSNGLINYYFMRTSAITAGLPITEGVSKLYFPAGKSLSGEGGTSGITYTLKTGSAWDIAVKGEKTASSSSYAESPPLVATRTYGKGRIVIIASDARCWINDAFAPAYGGFIHEKSDGTRFLENIFSYLGAPSLANKSVYARGECPAPKKEKAFAPGNIEPATRENIAAALAGSRENEKVFRGIIGLASSYSDGANTVKDMCREAKARGYDFAVFTEKYGAMNAEKWQMLERDCAAESNDSFVALAGLDVKGKKEYQFPECDRIMFNMCKFPQGTEVEQWSKGLFSLGVRGYPSVIVSKPNLNKLPPFRLRFYVGLALANYEHNKLIDEGMPWYRDLVASDYRLVPVSINKVYSIEELRATTGADTYVRAKSVKDIAAGLTTKYQSGKSFVSEGPLIRKFNLVSSREVSSSPLMTEPGQNLAISIDVASDVGIESVIIHRGTNVFRSFRPNTREFSSLVWIVNDQDSYFTMTVVDRKGRKAFSNLLKSYNAHNRAELCVDKQNMFITVGDGGGGKTIGITGNWISGADIGSLAFPVNGNERIPAGEDVTWPAISSFEIGMKYYVPGAIRSLAFPVRRIRFSSAECAVIENTFDSDDAHGTTTFTSFRPKANEYCFILVEQNFKMKRTVRLSERPDGEIILLRLVSNSVLSPFTHGIVYDGIGRTKDCVFTSGITSSEEVMTNLTLKEFGSQDLLHHCGVVMTGGTIARGGFAGLYPQAAGAVCVFPLDDGTYIARLGRTATKRHAFVTPVRKEREFIDLCRAIRPAVLEAGDVVTARYVIAIDGGEKATPASFGELKQKYGVSGKPAYSFKMERGEVIDTVFVPRLKAVRRAVEANVTVDVLPNPLGVIIEGLNPNWTGYMHDKLTGKGTAVGIDAGGKGYILLSSGAHSLVAGNVATSDNPDLKITLVRRTANTIVVEAHNPADAAKTVEITSPLFPVKSKTVTLAGGETKEVVLSY